MIKSSSRHVSLSTSLVKRYFEPAIGQLSQGRASNVVKIRKESTTTRDDVTAFTEYRTFDQNDVSNFVKMTSDANRLHVDPEEAKRLGFPSTIVPGILTASVFPSVISHNFPGAVYMSQTLKFRHYALVRIS